MFENLPLNQNNDRILLPGSYKKIKLPDGRIADSSIVFRESTKEVILSSKVEDRSDVMRTVSTVSAILIPGSAVTRIESKGVKVSLFGGAIIYATFFFNNNYEAKRMTNSVEYLMTNQFSLYMKADELKTVVERFNTLKM